MEQQTALNRYEQTWLRFTKELKSNPSITLRAVCRTMHTNTYGMSKWVSRKGYSVAKTKASISNPVGEIASTFVRIEPKEEPHIHKESLLSGISITFNSGTTVNIKQGDADSVIRIISLYERKDGELCIR